MWQARDNAGSVYQYRYFGSFRLLLATLVMAQHFGADLAPAALAAALAPYMTGSVAVLVFFALSGFVITEAIDSVYRGRPVPFLTNRLLRIVPHFLLAVALAMLAHEFFRLCGRRAAVALPAIVSGQCLWTVKRAVELFCHRADGAAGPRLRFLDDHLGRPGGDGVLPDDVLLHRDRAAASLAAWLRRDRKRLVGAHAAAVMAYHSGQTRSRHAGVHAIFRLRRRALLRHRRLARRMADRVGQHSNDAVAVYRKPDEEAVPIQGIPLSITGNLIILIALLGAMSALAFASIAKGRAIDRTFGDLTYPLYLYHEDVLVVILTVTTGYAYSTLAAGFVLSFVTAAILMMLVDPAVTRYRDKVRGRALRQAQVPIGSGAEPSAPAIGLRSAPR